MPRRFSSSRSWPAGACVCRPVSPGRRQASPLGDLVPTRPARIGQPPGRPQRLEPAAADRRPHLRTGLGTHAVSELVFDLDGPLSGSRQRRRRRGDAPLQDASVVFVVMGDGRELFRSDVDARRHPGPAR